MYYSGLGPQAIPGVGQQEHCFPAGPFASRADTHFNVCKESRGNETFTYIRRLNPAGRVQEIARMLGGGSDAGKLAEKMLKQK